MSSSNSLIVDVVPVLDLPGKPSTMRLLTVFSSVLCYESVYSTSSKQSSF